MLFLRFFSKFRYSAGRHWPWLAALVLLCFALSISLLELPALRLQNDGLVKQIQALETQLRAALPTTAHRLAVDLNQQLSSFDRLPIVVQDLHTLASQNGLHVSEASYTTMAHAAGANNADADEVQRIEIAARFSGNYLPLKSSLASLLAAHDECRINSEMR